MNVLWLLAFLIALAVFAVPGIFLAIRLRWGETPLEQALIGAALGLACAVFLGTAVSFIDLRGMVIVWPTFALGCYFWRGIHNSVGSAAADGDRRPTDSYRWAFLRGLWAAGRDDRVEQRLLLVVLALVAISRFAMAWGDRLPCGRDPAFHLILCQSVRIHHGMIFDWLPFENIPLNYPLGSHILVVLLAMVSRVSLLQSFNLLEPALGVLTTGLIYWLGRRLFPNGSIALFSAASYGLLAWYGSIGYYQWGGLPNELAMLFLLLMLLVIAESPAGPLATGRFATGRCGFCFAAIVLTHHHVLIAAGACLVTLMIYFAMSHDPLRRHWLIGRSLLLGLALSSFYLIPELHKSSPISATDVWSNDEHWMTWRELPGDFGWVFFGLTIVGIGLSLVIRRDRAGGVVWTSCITLVILFLLCEFAAPLLGRMIGHEPDMAFTPSRFLTDAVYFLAFFCGIALNDLSGWLFFSRADKRGFTVLIDAAEVDSVQTGLETPPRVLGANPFGRTAVMFGIFAASACFMPEWFRLTDRDEPPGFRAACAWINANTDASTIVGVDVYGIPYDFGIWTSYLCWRPSLPRTPIPVSEPRKLVPDRKAYVEALEEGEAAPVPPILKVVSIREQLPQMNYYPPNPLWRRMFGGKEMMVYQRYPLPTSSE